VGRNGHRLSFAVKGRADGALPGSGKRGDTAARQSLKPLLERERHKISHNVCKRFCEELIGCNLFKVRISCCRCAQIVMWVGLSSPSAARILCSCWFWREDFCKMYRNSSVLRSA
jgi:hypothetical protein